MKLINTATLAAVLLWAGCRCSEQRQQQLQAKAVQRPATEESSTYLAASQIIVAYQGAARAPAKVRRSKPEAEQLARQLVPQLRASPELFADLARKHSDAATASFGGNLGGWPRGRMPASLEEALLRLPVGTVSEAMEVPEGYQILYRRISLFAASRILISYHGAVPALPHVKRSRLEAIAIARGVASKVKAEPLTFGAAVATSSDDLVGRRAGGRIGRWVRGTQPAFIEEALDRMRLGEISAPLETPEGFLVLRRDPVY